MEHPETLDLATAQLPGEELHEYCRQRRAEGAVVPATFLGTPVYLITRHAVVREYLASHDRFPGGAMYQMATRPHIGRTFIDMDGTEHDIYRQLVTPAFRSRAVTQFTQEGLAPLIAELLGQLAPVGQADLAESFARVLPFWTISRKLGLPRGSEERQRAWVMALLSYPIDPDGAMTASAQVTEFLAPTIAERRANPQQDVISQLMAREYADTRLDDEDVASHVRLLYAVGAATTSDSLSTLLHRVLTEPGLYERAMDEPDCRPRIVAESLRMEPAVATLPRIAPSGGSIGGVELAPGSMVLVGLASANRDPLVFDHPDIFDIDRPETDIMSFGFGQKYCPGAHLARQQLTAALDALLDTLPDLKVKSATEPSTAVLRRVQHLRVEWVARRELPRN